MAQGFERLLEVAGEVRELVYLNSSGAQITSVATVIWSNEALRQEAIADTGSGNVYYKGDVLMTIRKSDFDGLPTRELYLQSPSGYVLHVADVVYDDETWRMTLVRNR
jgi:hypothetical protein